MQGPCLVQPLTRGSRSLNDMDTPKLSDGIWGSALFPKWMRLNPEVSGGTSSLSSTTKRGAILSHAAK